MPLFDVNLWNLLWDSGIGLGDNNQLVLQRDLRFTTTRTDSLTSSKPSVYIKHAYAAEETPVPLLLDGIAASADRLTSSMILSNDAKVNWLTSEGRALGGTQGSQTLIAGSYLLLIKASESTIPRIETIGNTVRVKSGEGFEYRLSAQGSGVLRASEATARCSITVKRLGGNSNGFALYPLLAATGEVSVRGQTLTPSQAGYAVAALAAAEAEQLVFESSAMPEYRQVLTLQNISLRPGTDYGILFFNANKTEFYSSFSAANPAGAVQVESFIPEDDSQLIYGLEDIYIDDPACDRDYNDLILVINPLQQPAPELGQYNYVLGSLFPMVNGVPNVLTSSSIHYDPIKQAFTADDTLGSLSTAFDITTAPVQIPGMNRFLSEWFIPQMTDKNNPNSLFTSCLNGVINLYTKKTRANSITDLQILGYKGLDFDQGANSNMHFSELGSTTDLLYAEIRKLSNYDPVSVWQGYDPLKDDNIIVSNVDEASLLKNLEALANPDKVPNPPYWYPSLLYTYQRPGQPTTMPGPVMLLRPGEKLRVNFTNKIQLGSLSLEQTQQSSYIPISTYGNTTSSGLGGVTSTNFHLHGIHINPEGFGDNVVARYSAGQSWTTEMDLNQEQASGSYWYHPHYHPSVNGQLYGGLAGFMEIGDTLGKIPLFAETPRNLVQLKNLQLGFRNGDVVLAGYDNGQPVNQMVMTTVNGEFQPNVDAGAGGWQSFSLSNFTNSLYYNIRFMNNGQALPIYIYGEDGHQLPQIRWASQGALGNQSADPSNQNPNNTLTIKYLQAENLVSLSPGKRLDVLVYLPQGSTEIDSFYAFQQTADSGATVTDFNILNMGSYPDLASTNTLINPSDPYDLGSLGPGQLATLNVNQSVPTLSKAQQDAVIQEANAGIKVQTVLPTTLPGDLDPQAVPSIDLFAQTPDGQDIWKATRQREFNWTRGTLVGPKQDYDAATQQELARIEALPEFKGIDYHYKRYRPLPIQGLLNGLGTSAFKAAPTSWLGYDNPFLINDHVFPNGNLTIAQVGTVEQWTNVNWSVAAAGIGKKASQSNQYIGHPFHVHINDFQVKNSDSELMNKRNLEDVTMINSSGYKYYNINADPASGKPIGIVEKQPLEGELHTIEEALKPETVRELATYGANTQTVKMLFQDYLGAYVFHCHIIPHEDAGMMQAVMVIDNTKWSWLLAAEGVPVERRRSATSDGNATASLEQRFELQLASNMARYGVRVETNDNVYLERFQVGDLNRDFVQDLLVASSGDGAVRVIDGRRLLDTGETQVRGTFIPYEGVSQAPWAFVDDFTGDGSKDILTGGFVPGAGVTRPAGLVNVHDFTIKGWTRSGSGDAWEEEFALNPWEFIPHHGSPDHGGMDHGSGTPVYSPLANLSSDLTSFSVGDFNLDNFPDYALAYAIDGGLRITIIDGAALSLALQTGRFEGGYDPSKALLADALLIDDSLKSVNHVVLTNGFNGYAQSAIENLLVTAQTSSGTKLFSLALDAGHFIATSEPVAAGTHQHGSGLMHPLDDQHVINLDATNYPLHLQAIDQLADDVTAATPVFNGARANGGLLAGERLLIAQGNGANGTASSSDQLINTAQQLVINFKQINTVDDQDLEGITTSTAATTFSPSQVEARNNLANLVYTAYCGGIVTPGVGAYWAADSLGQGDSAGLMVQQFVADPITNLLVQDHFRGPLESQSVSSIVEITSMTLYGRPATAAETAQAELAVAQGLSKTELPLYLLQSTKAVDRYRLGLLSAYSQWSNAQWGTDANVVGSFGQGLQSAQPDFQQLQNAVFQSGVIDSWQEAQRLFDGFKTASTQLLCGTPISPSGVF
ncbi:MAG: multicopper oxidase domain-containing protein [Cyanobium sp.]